MKNIKSLFYISVVIAILSACKGKTVDKEKDIEVLNGMFNTYVNSVLTNNLDGLMSVWDDDARRIGPDMPTIEGKENIRAFFKNIFESASTTMIPIGEPEVVVCKDLAYMYYHVSIILTPNDGGPVQNNDIKGLSIIRRKEDGSWKVYMDCMNYHPTLAVDTTDSLMLEEPSVYY